MATLVRWSSYPIEVAPGFAGEQPQLALTYSSQSTNERHSPRAPSGVAGEGWSIGLASITAQVYEAGSTAPGTWYFLSGIDHVSDRLIPRETPDLYETQHRSHIRVKKQGNCFRAWDNAGYYYELGVRHESCIG